MNQPEKPIEWDNREELSGVENEKFTQPSPELIEYARLHKMRLNLWSKVVQKVLRFRMQRQTKPQDQSTDD